MGDEIRRLTRSRAAAGLPRVTDPADARWSIARRATPEDKAFAAVQARGDTAMGVDQYTSTHLFEALPDGGRIELQRDRADSAGAAVARPV